MPGCGAVDTVAMMIKYFTRSLLIRLSEPIFLNFPIFKHNLKSWKLTKFTHHRKSDTGHRLFSCWSVISWHNSQPAQHPVSFIQALVGDVCVTVASILWSISCALFVAHYMHLSLTLTDRREGREKESLFCVGSKKRSIESYGDCLPFCISRRQCLFALAI